VERGFQQIVTQFGQKPSLRDPSADPCSKTLFHVKQNSLAIAPKFVSRETGVSPIANSVRESLFYVKRVVVQLSLCRASARGSMSVSRETQWAVLPWHPVQCSVSRETEFCVNSPRSAFSRETDADPNANSAQRKSVPRETQV